MALRETKFALLTQNRLFWGVLRALGEFCHAYAANQLSRASFVSHERCTTAPPATVPPTRRPTDVRKTSDSQISHAIPPAQESTHAPKPQNSNDPITGSEIQSGELHAKLRSNSRNCHRCRGRRRELPQCRWAVAGPGRAGPSDTAPLVWRAPEGPEGTGGLRGAAPNEVRSPSLAGGRALRRPEHQRHHKHPRTEKSQNSS